MGCCTSVEESTVGVIERFGAFSRIAPPGCVCLNCFTEKKVGELSLRIQQFEVNTETRTKDNVFVTIKMTVFAKVAESEAEFPAPFYSKEKQPADALPVILPPRQPQMGGANVPNSNLVYQAWYKLSKPYHQVQSMIEEYFRFHAMEYTLDQLYSAKNNLTHELQDILNKRMNPFGYIIKNVLVKDIDPEAKVKAAMNDIVATEKEVVAQRNRAEAEKLTALMKAEVGKQTSIMNAEAGATTRRLEGEGIAAARQAIIKGLQESVQDFHKAIPGADPTQLLTTVLMTQYMDTIKDAASRGHSTFILSSSPCQVATTEDQMRTALLSANSGNKKD
jgi:regulator of protease activity HflC (stomatin/prohibitin superfamily)